MRRLALALLAVVFVFGLAACGGEEEASPEPEDTTGTITTTDTETTETETTATETTETETTETETTTGEPTGEGDPVAGKEVFASAGCGSCHTLSDAGSSGSIGPNLDDAMPSAELAVERVTNGQGAMPSFKDQLTPQQIADVAAYVSTAAGG